METIKQDITAAEIDEIPEQTGGKETGKDLIDSGLSKESIEKEQEPTTTEQNYPLVSCIMPTANRYKYVFESIRSFLGQDYPNKELIIVFDKVSDLPAIEFPQNVRLIQAKNTILGAKRNEACRHAQGVIIAQWDDDDIYNTNRLTLQAMPIITGKADVTGLQHFVFYEMATGKGWLPKKSLFSEIFVGNVHGGSLVFNKRLWERLNMYPHYTSGEDAAFLKWVVKKGARLIPLYGYDSFLYVRHNSNTWKFEENNFRKYSGWTPARLPAWALQQAQLYRNIAMADLPGKAQVNKYNRVSA
jgi:glycosyltransferase involved in cell wall biosynthesis